MISRLNSTVIAILTYTILLQGCNQEENISKTQPKDTTTQQVPTQNDNGLETPTLSATKISGLIEKPLQATTVVIDSDIESAPTKIPSNSTNSNNALIPNWTLAAEVDSIGPEGVSPEAVVLDDGIVRLYVTNMGIEIWDSSFRR